MNKFENGMCKSNKIYNINPIRNIKRTVDINEF